MAIDGFCLIISTNLQRQMVSFGWKMFDVELLFQAQYVKALCHVRICSVCLYGYVPMSRCLCSVDVLPATVQYIYVHE